MLTYSSGAAFIDGAGAIVVADPGFLAALGLSRKDPTGALRARAEENPPLRALLGGEGPDVVWLAREDGGVELRRHLAPEGCLLLARTARLQELLEQGQSSSALTRLLPGVSHDIKNPLNAMALQLAILAEKLFPHAQAAAESATHLGALREQVGRVNEVLRRFVDLTDPSAPLGYTELGALLAEAVALFGHETRRRRIQLVVRAPRGVAKAAGDPARVVRLVLVLLAEAMAEAPDGGRIDAAVEVAEEQAVLRLSHPMGDGEAQPSYDLEVGRAAAAALGGALAEQREEGVRRVELRLPRVERT